MVWWEGASNWVTYADCAGLFSAALNVARPPVQKPVSQATWQMDVLMLLTSLPPRGQYGCSESFVQQKSSSRRSRRPRVPVLSQASTESVQEVDTVAETQSTPEVVSSASLSEATEEQFKQVLAKLDGMAVADVKQLLHRARDATTMAELRSIVKLYGLPVRKEAIRLTAFESKQFFIARVLACASR